MWWLEPKCHGCCSPPALLPAGHTSMQRGQGGATPTSRLHTPQHSPGDDVAGGIAGLRLGGPAVTPLPLPAPAPAGTPSGGSASQRLADLQQRHAQLLADVDAAERRQAAAQAAAAQAEGEAAAAQERLSTAAQQAQEREAAVAALAAEEAAARERLATLADSTRQQEAAGHAAQQAAQQAQQEAATAGQQLEAVRCALGCAVLVCCFAPPCMAECCSGCCTAEPRPLTAVPRPTSRCAAPSWPPPSGSLRRPRDGWRTKLSACAPR